MDQLGTGDRLPSIRAVDLDGSPVDIAAQLVDRWSVLLVYRGDW